MQQHLIKDKDKTSNKSATAEPRTSRTTTATITYKLVEF